MKVFQNYHRHAMYTNVRISDSAVSPKDYAEQNPVSQIDDCRYALDIHFVQPTHLFNFVWVDYQENRDVVLLSEVDEPRNKFFLFLIFVLLVGFEVDRRQVVDDV